MHDINSLFRNRIGFPLGEKLTFASLNEVLEKTAKTIPFENICVINKSAKDITAENLVNKILERKEGGLCYELNTIFYLFLKENGFDVSLVQGAVYDHPSKDWARTGRTHVTILLRYEMETFLIDTGFGGNLPLQPVPFNGDAVASKTGEFRVKKLESAYGNYCLEMKVRYKDDDWKIGYAFDSNREVHDLTELNEVKRIIAESEHSAFNKAPLITRISDDGNITLTNTSFSVWKNGAVTKEQIDEARFKELAKQHFKMDV